MDRIAYTEEVITSVKELVKEDTQQLMENGTIFEWIPGNMLLDDQEDEEVFDNLINNLQHHHNDENVSNYVPDNSDGDNDILGSWEAEYASMEEE